jgi:hypothetical protein
MIDLWPQQLGTLPIKAPVTILKEQASILGTKTQNVVIAEVTHARGEAGRFAYDFDLVAPALQSYRFELFSIEYGIDLYPVYFTLEGTLRNEIMPDLKTKYATTQNEQGFLALLKQILNSNRTKQAILTLVAQSGAGDVKEELPF